MMAAIAAANAEQGLTDVFCFHATGKHFTQVPDSDPVHFQIQEKGDSHKVAIIDSYRKEFNWFQNRTDNTGTSYLYIAPSDDNGKTLEILDIHKNSNRFIMARVQGDLKSGKAIKTTEYTCPLS